MGGDATDEGQREDEKGRAHRKYPEKMGGAFMQRRGEFNRRGPRRKAAYPVSRMQKRAPFVDREVFKSGRALIREADKRLKEQTLNSFR